MLELIAIWCFGRSMYETARQKGRHGWGWVLAFAIVWFSAEFIGASVFSVGMTLIAGTGPNRFFVYLAALGSAFAAGILLGKILDGRPSLIPPPLPSKPRQKASVLAPSQQEQSGSVEPMSMPRVQFKFSCPHCGQHIAATSDQALTQATCPACDNVLIVPSARSALTN